MENQANTESLLAAYAVPGFRARTRVEVYEIKKHPAFAITLNRHQKKRCAGFAARRITVSTTANGTALAISIAERTRFIWTLSFAAWTAKGVAA